MLRFLTAGESHGPRLTVIVDGLPAGLRVRAADIDADLRRRQGGYGRGGRQQIERDTVEIVGGVRLGRTLGTPVALAVTNRDFANWEKTMSPLPTGFAPTKVTRVRPGHADLAGALKYGFDDVRNVLERASARETTSRVAAGGLAKALLREFGIEVRSFVRSLGEVVARVPEEVDWTAVEASPVRTPDPESEARMIAAVDAARAGGDTLGGVFTVVATGVPVGLGTYAQWDERLDAALGHAVLSIPAVKGVEIGDGVAAAALPGSLVHDQPRYSAERGFFHLSNRQGGLTGGITDGMPVVVSGYLKPISTLKQPLTSVDLVTREEIQAHYERSDICVVPAAGVIGEAMVALTLARALQRKTGGDSLREMKRNLAAYLRTVR
ncbi:MAG TPA: chorismate synthase [Candidatus Dormibacteraeota bacterium]|nr:chorismate synthase [Candidatus Dormibacteraeota bacterium]